MAAQYRRPLRPHGLAARANIAPLTADGLQALGYTSSWEALFAALAAPELRPARVVLEHGKFLRVHDGQSEHLAVPSGRLRHEAASAAELPTVGDWVAVGGSGESTAAAAAPSTEALLPIRAVLPRQSRFSRRRVGNRDEEQVVAANVDLVLLLMGLDSDFNLRRLERFLSLVLASGASPVVVLNKADAAVDLPGQRQAVAALVGEAPVVTTSLRDPDGHLAVLPFVGSGPPGAGAWPARQTVALLGSSGVGKSTLLNRLCGEDLQRTGEVRAGDGRGRHTTSYAQLFRLPQGALCIDTPGLREIQLWAAEEGLDGAFPEIQTLAGGCRFGDCRHGAGQPGCQVQASLAAGTLADDRWQGFLKLRGELEAGAARATAASRRPAKGRRR
jgi:ribosome biogenesis GTPase / thiamine phosphate phosphatase